MRMTQKTQSKFKIAAVTAAAIAVSACATDDPNRRAKTGAAIGAVLGAVAGNAASDARGAPIVGAVVGAIAGGAVGNYMDKQKAELERQLAAEAAAKELSITRISDDALLIGIASDVSFDLGSANLKGSAEATYAKIANVLKNYDKTVIHIVGHTDTSGSNELNQNLSVQRASAVSSFMVSRGVISERVRQEGRGEREPLVRTGDGVKEPRNRRVDIVIKPVIEGKEQAAWTPPPYLGG